jgi:hypothetical protein
MKKILFPLAAVAGALALAACGEVETTAPLLSADITFSQAEQTCPDTGVGDPPWTKIDGLDPEAEAGGETLPFGSIAWEDKDFTWDVNEGYTVEFCLKYATNVDYWTAPDPEAEPEVPASGTVTLSNALSHMSWRILDEPEEQEYYGCSAGYWSNTRMDWDGNDLRELTLGDVFNYADLYYAGTQLIDALAFGGGRGDEGAARILLRQAAAAYLNVTVLEDLEYDFGFDGDLAEAVKEAMAQGREAMLELADQLDAMNNAGCPIDNWGNEIDEEEEQ